MAEAGGRGDIDPTGSSQVMYQDPAPTVVSEPVRSDDLPRHDSNHNAAAHVDISQVSVNRNVAPRKEIRYLIRLRNASPGTARNLVLRCALPLETSFIEGSVRLNGRPPVIEGPADPSRGFPLPDLEPDSEAEIAFACNVHSGLRDGSLLYQTVTLLTNDRPMSTHTSCAIVRGTPNLADSHACRLLANPAGEVAPGDVITYTFSLSNNGTAPATGLMLFTAPPSHVSYLPNSTRWEGIPLADVDEGSPLFARDGFFIGSLEPGQAHSASLQVRVDRPLDNGRRLSCEGELRSHEGETVKLEAVTHQVRSAPDFSDASLNRLVVLHDGNAVERVAPGDVLTVSVEYANRGNSHAYDSRVWVELPPQLEYVSGTLRQGDRAVAQDQTASRALFSEHGYVVGTVEAPSDARRADGDKLAFQARVAWPLANDTELGLRGGIVSADNHRHDFSPLTVRVQSQPRFHEADSNLSVQPTGPVRPGDVLTYTIRYRNNGDAPATGVVMRAGLPFEADVVPGSTRWDGRAIADEDGTSVLLSVAGLELGTVDAGRFGDVTFQATVARPLYAGTNIMAKAALTCEEIPAVVFAPVSVEVTSRADFSNRETNYIEVNNLRGNADNVISPSDTVHFTLHFKNEGDSNADNVVLRAPLPENATPVPRTTTLMLEAPRVAAHERSVSDVNGISPLFSENGYALGKVEAGCIGRLTYAVKVNRPLVDGSYVTHGASLTSDQSDDMHLDEARVRITARPNFTETQWNRLIVSPAGTVSPGQKLAYSLEYRNTGGADATTAVARVTLPEEVEYVPESVFLNGSQIADVDNVNALFSERGLELGDVAIDRSGRVTFEGRVKSPLDNGTPLECAVQVSCDQLGDAVRHTVENKVTSAPDFGQPRLNYLSAEPAERIAPNDIITYTVAFSNTGDARAYRVSVRANVPQQVSYVPGSTRLNDRAVPDQDDIGPLFTSNGLLVGGEDADQEGVVTFQVRVASPLENDSTIETQAFIALGERRGGLGTEPQRRFPTNRITHRVHSAPDFSDAGGTFIEVSPDATVRPGETLHYTLHVLNGGTAHAQDVSVRAFVPPYTNLTPGTVRIGGAFATNEETDHLFSPRGKSIGRVEAGASCIITYQVRVDSPLDNETAIVNKALIMATGIAPVNTPEVQTLVNSAADFSSEAGNRVVAQVTAAQPGEAVTYTIYYKNGGDANAYNLAAKLQLPDNDLHYVPHLTTVNGVPVGVQARTLNAVLGEGLPIGDVAAGASGEASFTVRVDAAARDGVRLPIVVELHTPQGPPSILEGTPLEVSAPPAFSDPAFNHLDVYPAGSVACEEILTYTLTYGNRTNAPASDVVLRCSVPEHTVYVEDTVFLNGEPVDDTAKGNPLFDAAGLRLGNVEARTSGEVVFQARVKKNAANGTVIACTATIQSGDKAPFTTNTTRNNVHSLIDFSGSEGAHLEVTPAQNAAPGEMLTFVFNYRNRGNATATNVALRGKLPENATYVGRSTKLNGIPVKDMKRMSPIFTEEGLLLPEIPPGGSGRILYRLQVGTQLPANSTVTSQLSLSCDQIPAVSSNTVTNTVISYPSFRPGEGTFLQSHPPRFVMPGSTITFVLYYQNSGSTHAKELRLHGRIPARTSYVAGTTRVDGTPVDDVDGISPVFDKEGLSVGRVEAGASGDVSLQLRVHEDTADQTPLQLDVELSTLPPTQPIQLSGQVTVSTKPPQPEPVVEPAPAPEERHLAEASRTSERAVEEPAAHVGSSAEAAVAAAEAVVASATVEATAAATEAEELDAAERAAARQLEEQEQAENEQRQRDAEERARRERDTDEGREDEERTRRDTDEAEQRRREDEERARREREAEEAEQRRRDDEERARREREAQEAEQRRRDDEERARREREAAEAEQRQREEAERRRREDEERAREEAELRQREEAERRRREEEEAERRRRDDEERARREREAEELEQRQREEAERRRREQEERDRREAEEAERRRLEEEAELAEQIEREEAERLRRLEEETARRRRDDEERARREEEERAALAALEAEEAAARAALEAEEQTSEADVEEELNAEIAAQREAAEEEAEAETEAEAEDEDDEGEPYSEEDYDDEDEDEAESYEDEDEEAAEDLDEDEGADYEEVREEDEDDEDYDRERDEDDDDDEDEADSRADDTAVLKPLPTQSLSDLTQGIATSPPTGTATLPAAAANLPTMAGEIPLPLDPNDAADPYKRAQAHYERGMNYTKMGDYRKAIEDLTMAAHLNPTDAHPLYNRGYAWLRAGMFAEAIEDFTAGLRLKPGDANVYFNLGNAYGKAGNFQSAMRVYSEAIRINPSFAPAYANRGLTYWKLGMNEQAEKDFSAAIRLDPQIKAKLPDGPWKKG